MLNGLLCLLNILMAFRVEAALAFFLARHSWQWSGERYSPRTMFMNYEDQNTFSFTTTFWGKFNMDKVAKIISPGQGVDERKSK